VSDRKQVREYRTGIPEGVPVGPIAVLPGVAPPLGDKNDRHRRVGDSRLAARRLGEHSPVVARPQYVEPVGVGVEAVDTRVERPTIAGDGIQVDVIEFARTRRDSKAHLPAAHLEFLCDARGIVTERIEVRLAGRGVLASSGTGARLGDHPERGRLGRRERARRRNVW